MRPASHIASSMVNGTHCTLFRRGEVPAFAERATESVGEAVGFRRATETCARCGGVQVGTKSG